MRRVKQAIRELVSVFAEEETAQIGEMGNNRFFRAARQNIFVFSLFLLTNSNESAMIVPFILCDRRIKRRKRDVFWEQSNVDRYVHGHDDAQNMSRPFYCLPITYRIAFTGVCFA